MKVGIASSETSAQTKMLTLSRLLPCYFILAVKSFALSSPTACHALPYISALATASITQQTRSTSSTLAQSSPQSTIDVTVGSGGNLIFDPSTVDATKGTVIRFNFLALNHSLTQSTYQNPCESNGQFDTHFAQFNPKNESGEFLVDFLVETDSPSWFYCAQTIGKSHCSEGMVFSLNAQGNSEIFRQRAQSSKVISTTSTSATVSGSSSTTLGSSRTTGGSVLSGRIGTSSSTATNSPTSNDGAVLAIGTAEFVVLIFVFLVAVVPWFFLLPL